MKHIRFWKCLCQKNDDPFKPSVSYFETEPYCSEEAIVYEGESAGAVPPSFWFSHSMSAVLNSCIDGGFSIEKLEEYPHSNREVDYDIYANQQAQIPMCFSLVATKT